MRPPQATRRSGGRARIEQSGFEGRAAIGAAAAACLAAAVVAAGSPARVIREIGEGDRVHVSDR